MVKQSGSDLILRCPFCGDSQHHLHKGHFYVNIETGVYHCYRCDISGKLPVSVHFQLMLGNGIAPFHPRTISPATAPELLEGAATTRRSALERYHCTYKEETWDGFVIRDARHNEEVGYHLRQPKKSFTYGERGIAWVGANRLSSGISEPITVVEGPYDVQNEKDACVFGFLSFGTLMKHFKGHYIKLCPDGDIWTDPEKTKRFMKTVRSLIVNPAAPTLVGIEVILGGKDPDEVPAAERVLVSKNELKEFFNSINSVREVA